MKTMIMPNNKVCFTITYTLTKKETNLFKLIEKTGYIEFKKLTTAKEKENLKICYILVEAGLLSRDHLAWHRTYNLSRIAKKILAKED